MTQLIFAILIILIAIGLYVYICRLKATASLFENIMAFATIICLCVAVAICFLGTLGGFN